ncbi:hypothetical protein HRR83_005583 [Exophiala dermatitidis]|uniref:Uncharacterized protein n=1 Tax=Exophiala dermatitidis (strain ATCC 34100 / CBS 525.76 / NIH/UT8656) TaxID=858893 RepID=H6BW64_EXODN|nr:uncharacterized protein HMPREF1120_03314 [Exophiala dermatitidis NIH/UT8656]KAJ4502484.1 hypothetical protein HRR75_008464 [Exophiala dermatitidis]EHY55164.1 hypothetical protein HMPREF1120_03314 [Exophiala dermatitidis NIH/UT8656]KAJ4503813.1 hypothetical protein HRR74_009204 [Exophiala dermatitidis]KAJ4508146.1 hypothetical protein HRR73_007585 [Exophiala dermatitidis]KAJ4537899.1 hypothetical protein HRR78_008491 [Exophiala dermatitidis]
MPLPTRQDTASSRSSTSTSKSNSPSSPSSSGGGQVRQIIDDRYVDPDRLKSYMKKNFAQGTWAVQAKLGIITITAPRLIPKEDFALFTVGSY